MSSDWYLDPPDEPDGPNCPVCEDGWGDYISSTGENDLYRCDECGHEWSVPAAADWDLPDKEETEESDDESLRILWEDQNKLCPHGIPWAECNDCMIASDLAYDANREGR